MQVVNALIKANKMFDLLVVPGGGHGAGRTNGPTSQCPVSGGGPIFSSAISRA